MNYILVSKFDFPTPTIGSYESACQLIDNSDYHSSTVEHAPPSDTNGRSTRTKKTTDRMKEYMESVRSQRNLDDCGDSSESSLFANEEEEPINEPELEVEDKDESDEWGIAQ